MRTRFGCLAALLVGVAATGIERMMASEPATTTRGSELPFSVAKETTNIVGPLLADGRVDYVAALNERYSKGVTPENNGFVAWLKIVGTGEDVMPHNIMAQVLKMCGGQEPPASAKRWVRYADFLKSERGLDGDRLDVATQELVAAGQEMWNASDRPQVAAFLNTYQKQLDAIVEAANKPRWWLPYVTTSGHSMCETKLPSLGVMRDAGNALAARATLRIKAGDFDGFLTDVLAAKKLARQVGSGSTMIERLVGVAIDRQATSAIGVAAGHGALSESQCKKASAALSGLEPMPPISDAVDVAERWTLLEYASAVSVWDKDSIVKVSERMGDPVVEFGKVDRKGTDWNTVLHFINGIQDETVVALRNENYQTMTKEMGLIDQRITGWGPDLEKNPTFGPSPGETHDEYTLRMGKTFVYLLRPVIWKAEVLWRWSEMEDRMLTVVLAAGEVRGRTGKWPSTLDDLVPGQPKELPRDIHSTDSAQAVKYVVTAEGIRVYSVGQNGIDEEGKFDADKKAKEEKEDDLGVGVVVK